MIMIAECDQHKRPSISYLLMSVLTYNHCRATNRNQRCGRKFNVSLLALSLGIALAALSGVVVVDQDVNFMLCRLTVVGGRSVR